MYSGRTLISTQPSSRGCSNCNYRFRAGNTAFSHRSRFLAFLTKFPAFYDFFTVKSIYLSHTRPFEAHVMFVVSRDFTFSRVKTMRFSALIIDGSLVEEHVSHFSRMLPDLPGTLSRVSMTRC